MGIHTVRHDRKNKGGGGLVVYILEKHKFIHRQNLECVNVESIWIEICPSNSRCFLLANVYRPLSASIDWFHNFGDQLKGASCANLDIVILGDFNINFFREIS